MKKRIYTLLKMVALSLIFTAITTQSQAQQKLIHYWNFNNFNTGLSAGVNPSTLTPIHASWSSLDSTKATIAYKIVPGTSSSYQTYWDNNPGDTLNLKEGAVAGLALRVRNPSDSMQLLFTMPTTHYKNITLAFETEKSSLTSGMGKQVFDYSPDGGTTWKTSGLSMGSDSLTVKSWGLLSVAINDTSAYNKADFIFRIRFKTLNTGTSGNNRFDNVSLSGDTIISGSTPSPSQKLIHYWHFNNFTGLGAAGSPSLIVPFHANWSSLDSTKATIAYVPSYAVSSQYATYWDAVAGDTLNSRLAEKDQTTGTNNALRVRNPSDSMELRFYIPTTHYKNINIKYELEKSSTGSGQGKQVFDYSVDNGKSWSTTALSILEDSVPDANWDPISLSFTTADSLVNNNPNFIFRIKFKTNNTGTSGNNRFDNFTVEGDTDKGTPQQVLAGIAKSPIKVTIYSIFPNPVMDNMTIVTGNNASKTIFIYDMEGRIVASTQSHETSISVNTATLSKGMYLVRVIEMGNSTATNLKMVKN